MGDSHDRDVVCGDIRGGGHEGMEGLDFLPSGDMG